jgi:hypothetical protein
MIAVISFMLPKIVLLEVLDVTVDTGLERRPGRLQ